MKVCWLAVGGGVGGKREIMATGRALRLRRKRAGPERHRMGVPHIRSSKAVTDGSCVAAELTMEREAKTESIARGMR